MKLLARDPDRIVLHLTARDRHGLRGLLRLAAACKRLPPQVTRGEANRLPADAAEMLARAMSEHREGSREGVLGWLEDPSRCVPGKGGFGLTLTEAEAETFLQAINGCKLAYWETLGCPDFDNPPWTEPTPEIETLAYSMDLASVFVGMLVDILSGEKDSG